MKVPQYYRFDYSIMNDQGEVVDSSEGGEPLSFIEGDGTMIKGLQRALQNRSAGDEFKVTVAPEDAYGWPQRSLIRTVFPEMFEGIPGDIEVGMLFQVGSDREAEVVKVVAVNGDEISVDGNHPLAGISLNFGIRVIEARDATPEEVDLIGSSPGDGDFL
ncbi:MAG: FKBP-type peptidyl-prolyl cis-trans isomerase [Pseudomonadales bacterium]|jgi:FKBP-type peptidyl-prolyl cis-trans isomerase SlyD|nr:FKBP-type peptidyl-prolyl cis-trans isomerase [Pseudomonadales bacterium]MDP7145196.1 FKBP-type peptidyl-prolyl cis-trans isomerase [Pseudomonadales bacterium]MDP7357666.1 FKBP-type peptidyl-prolyl cis-trans isomerase [Pseudomonadales bacterium]MDP7594039.1 FKBP-type peptidyl-prolyl cis-trans isomerase [Pseudomonadales bacterium]HJN49920.1 FKBP-type peptidyl-prolyl cis-trans isomerase [Pseudomonadales bacterium]|tara:strand:+ start:2204 stop:2683 length:480 start_codon:yes stop_codon:yes gene_type:complete